MSIWTVVQGKIMLESDITFSTSQSQCCEEFLDSERVFQAYEKSVGWRVGPDNSMSMEWNKGTGPWYKASAASFVAQAVAKNCLKQLEPSINIKIRSIVLSIQVPS